MKYPFVFSILIFLSKFCASAAIEFPQSTAAVPLAIDAPKLALKNEDLLSELQIMMSYSYAVNCKATWQLSGEGDFPRGNSMEQHTPSTLVKGFFDTKSTNAAYVAYNDHHKIIIASFRPTITKTLWVQNLKFWRTRPPITDLRLGKGNQSSFILPDVATTHSGFNFDYSLFREQLIPLVYNLSMTLPADYRIIFTGHSLGAALAELAAVDFTLNTMHNSSITDRVWSYPFASPRVGSRGWARMVNNLPFGRLGQSIRLARYHDPTPQIPFKFMGYEQTFREIILWENGTLTVCPNSLKDPESGECEMSYTWFGDPRLHFGYRYLKFLGIEFQCERG